MGFIQRRAPIPFFVQPTASRTASLVGTLADATVVATATVSVSASTTATLGACTSAGTATVAVAANLAATLGACSVAATATAAVSATLGATLGACSLAATATAGVNASLAQTLGGLAFSGSATTGASNNASLNATLGALTVSAAATTGGAIAPTGPDTSGGSFTVGGKPVWRFKTKKPWPEDLEIVNLPEPVVNPPEPIVNPEVTEIVSPIVSYPIFEFDPTPTSVPDFLSFAPLPSPASFDDEEALIYILLEAA